MPLDFSDTRETIGRLRSDAAECFDVLSALPESEDPYWGTPQLDHFWDQLDNDMKHRSRDLQRELLEAIKPIANALSFSALTTDADRRDLTISIKTARAALRLRRFDFSEIEVLHDEGVVLGVQPETQSEVSPLHPTKAMNIFDSRLERILDLVDYVELSPTLPTAQWEVNPQSTASYEPNTAFVMMAIDPDDPGLEDTFEVIRECFDCFEIQAVRADEIQHEGVITEEIRKRIQTSEFLLADMSLERPNVYYEVGYAHALQRRVILYRKAETRLHFDLSVYNCPEYKNNTQLRELLVSRLEHMTGRSATQS